MAVTRTMAQARLAAQLANRCFTTSACVTEAQQAVKQTADPVTGQPANPSPPPRAASSTPPVGAESFKNAGPQAETMARRPPKPPMPSQAREVVGKVVRGMAWMMGYNSKTSTAIRVTSDLYDRCAELWELDKEFWQEECHLPPTYQSWFQVTNLHVMLLLIRFRSLPAAYADVYQQELVNHFFIDAETRMRKRFGIQTGRLVKGYMREMHNQHRGALLAIDEAIAMIGKDGQGDSRLAMALWRNVFGAGWGDVGGVLSKVKGIDRTPKGEEHIADQGPQLAADAGPSADVSDASSPSAIKLAQQRRNAFRQGKVSSGLDSADPLAAENPSLAFPIVLSRLTKFFLRELRRLAAISDHEMEVGRLARAPGPAEGRAPPPHISPANAASVGAGEAVERAQIRPLGLDVQTEKSRSGEAPSSGQQRGEDALSVASFGSP